MIRGKIFSLILILLLLISVTVPPACAGVPYEWKEPELGAAPVVVFAIPEVAKLTIDGATIILGSSFVMKIGQDLGTRWDDFVKTMGIVGKTEKDTGEKTRIEDPAGNTVTVLEPLWKVKENWEKFVSDVTKGIDDLIHAKKWVDVTSNEGKALMTVIYEYYTSQGVASGGKKDDKWYFEARLNHGKIEINPERMTEDQAVKEMGRGKHIMTLNDELAQNLVGRFKGLTETETKKQLFEGSHDPPAGKFLHLHYEANGMRLHCWSWK